MTDMSKFPFLATGSFTLEALQRRLIQCSVADFSTNRPITQKMSLKNYVPPMEFEGLNPSFFMIWGT